jgi:leucyl aminopeptidase
MTDLIATPRASDDVEAIAVGVTSQSGSASPGADSGRLGRRGFDAELGTTAVLDEPGDEPLRVVVGLGEPERVDAEALRRAGAAGYRAAGRAASLAFELNGFAQTGLDVPAVARALGEGALLASYSFDRYASKPPDSRVGRVEIVTPEPGAVAGALERAAIVAGAVHLARDLVNTPAGDLTPQAFAEIAQDVAAREALGVHVMDEREIVEERLGGLLAVARGSAEPPRLVRLEHVPEGAPTATVVLVGKGITFDSGGLSLKTATGMMTMKTDMSGAAAVLAVLGACRRLGVAVRVVGLMPLTENMPGGRATKPGDVLRARNGKTIEVLNTDAEGRLVLADALSLAAEESPDAIVDLATLTGACVAALGSSIAGVMGNDDRLVSAVASAAGRAGEPVWHLPLPAGYRPQIASEIADMKNIGVPGQAGALTAGLLLEEFVGSTPWAHLDIAGPARSETSEGYLSKGGTGFGVRTLLELLGSYVPLGGTVAGRPTGTEVLR